MDQYICTCAIKIGDGNLDEKIGFGFERIEFGAKREEPFYKIIDENNVFDGIIGLVNLFNSVVRSKIDESDIFSLDYFLQLAKNRILTDIEIENIYADIYLNVSIDRLDKFFDKNGLKNDSYLTYINVNLDNEKDVIDYVLKDDLDGSFDEEDVNDGFVQLEKVADGVWVVQVDHA